MSDMGAREICGIVMPISAIDGLSENHWADVLGMISDAATKAGFNANLVSNADDVGVIQKRIIQNLYDNAIVVCDVSGKNPNVMFELGMRLAFNKPTIIVKDDKTSYSFDTSPIEHVSYPRDLRYSQVVDFKQKLADKIMATHARAQSDTNYTSFLGHFGEFTVAKIEKKELPGQEYVLQELNVIRTTLQRIERVSISTDVGTKRLSRFSVYDLKIENPLDGQVISVAISEGTTVNDVLNKVYHMIAPRVDAFTYLQSWVLTHKKSGIRLIIKEISEFVQAAAVFKPGSIWEINILEAAYNVKDMEPSFRAVSDLT
jgi:hypothetical protein